MSVVDALVTALEEVAVPERAVKEKAYLKSELVHLGARVPDVRKAVAAIDAPSVPLWPTVDALWGRGVHELKLAAVVLLHRRERELTRADVARLEALLRTCFTWALLDDLAVNTVGALVAREPAMGAVLDRWATDDDFWLRRTALLALLKPLRRGGGDWARFCRYADAMLEEKEFFIRKAIGWVLREASKERSDEVVAWIAPRTHRASGVTMRETVRRLDAAQAERLMAAYREKRPAS